jgi:hypothetical protein
VSRQQLAATVVPANATPIAAPICLPWTEARNSMQLHLVHHCIGFCFFGLWDAHWSAILLMFAYVEQQAVLHYFLLLVSINAAHPEHFS